MNYADYLYPTTNLKTNKFIGLILAIQLIIIGLIYLEISGTDIPILTEVIGFIYLTFVPGILVLRILRLKKLNIIETLLYSTGLSMASVMFIGLLINSVYPQFGISKPISLIPIVVTITALVCLLCLVLYLVEKWRKITYNTNILNLKEFFSKKVLLLLLIPFLSIFGTYLVNFYNEHILLFALILIISIMPVLVLFSKKIKEDMYPLIIFITSVSLLLHWSLITMHISGGDINYEYYFMNMVYLDGHWASGIPGNLNAMLSLVMLGPIYSNILDLNLVWILKIVYPLIYSLVPLGLYQIFKKQTNSKIALLSVFYFMFVFPFFSEMLQLGRQEIAELFLAVIILVLTGSKINNISKSILLVIFGLSLVVSHYGLSYIFLLVIVSFVIFNKLSEANIMKKILNSTSYMKNWVAKHLENSGNLNDSYLNLTYTFILLFLVFVFAWYSYISQSTPFNSILLIGNHIAATFREDLFDTKNLQAVSMLLYNYSRFHAITKYLYLISQFAIIIGVLALFLRSRFTEFTKDYKFLSLACMVILGFCLFLPNFASSLNTTRLFHIILFILAPFSVMGTIIFFKFLDKIFKFKMALDEGKSLKIFSIFLMIFMLFTSGFAYELLNDEPVSIALSCNYDFPKYTSQEVNGAMWISNHSTSNKIASDTFGLYLLDEFMQLSRTSVFSGDNNFEIIYLRGICVKENRITIVTRNYTIAQTHYYDINNLIRNTNKIYSNGGSDVYEK